MMLIEELDRPFYLVHAVRRPEGFFDKEVQIDPEYVEILREHQERTLQAQLLLRTIYMLGDNPKVEIPAWLEEARNARKQKPQGSAQASSKKSQQTLTLKGSSTSTNP